MMCPTFTHLFRTMVFKSLQKKITHDSLLLHFENYGEILEKGLFSPYNSRKSPLLGQKKSAPPHIQMPDAGHLPKNLHVVDFCPKELGSFSIDDLIIRNTPERAPEAKDGNGKPIPTGCFFRHKKHAEKNVKRSISQQNGGEGVG